MVVIGRIAAKYESFSRIRQVAPRMYAQLIHGSLGQCESAVFSQGSPYSEKWRRVQKWFTE